MFTIDPVQLAVEFTLGVIIGVLIGFTAKKIGKLVAIIIGGQLILGKILESRGVLIINWDKLTGIASETTLLPPDPTPPSWAMTIFSAVSVGIGFGIGFFITFKKA